MRSQSQVAAAARTITIFDRSASNNDGDDGIGESKKEIVFGLVRRAAESAEVSSWCINWQHPNTPSIQ